jgi:pyridoxine 5-phosphate synthase
LDVVKDEYKLAQYITPLREKGCRVSIFLAADEKQIRAASRIGANVVELHTGAYCDLHYENKVKERDDELSRLTEMASLAHSLGLEVHAGHGLTFETVSPIAELPEVVELNIGHFLIGESIFVGLREAIIRMRELMDKARLQ